MTDAAKVDGESVGASDYIRNYKGNNENIYLIGSFNGWAANDSNWKLTKTNNNENEGSFTLSGYNSYDFKIFTDNAFYSGNYEFKTNATGVYSKIKVHKRAPKSA